MARWARSRGQDRPLPSPFSPRSAHSPMTLRTQFSFLETFWSCPIREAVLSLLRAARPMFLRFWWISWASCSLTVSIASSSGLDHGGEQAGTWGQPQTLKLHTISRAHAREMPGHPAALTPDPGSLSPVGGAVSPPLPSRQYSLYDTLFLENKINYKINSGQGLYIHSVCFNSV